MMAKKGDVIKNIIIRFAQFLAQFFAQRPINQRRQMHLLKLTHSCLTQGVDHILAGITCGGFVIDHNQGFGVFNVRL